MDAPPEKEDCRSYIAIAQRLIAAGLTAPRIVSRDVEHGFLLLTDLGNRIYLQELYGDKVARLYGDAINAILAMQARVEGHGLPPYGRELLMREMERFREWLLRWHLGISLTLNEHDMLTDSFGLLADAALSQPQAFVHRDYHSRNLMVIGSNNPGILDFQDAVIGPVSYDLVSLLRDCYISWPRAQVIAWATRYFEQAVESGVLGALNLATFLTEFADETRNTPPNVSTRELPNEFLDFLGHGRAARSSMLAERGPVIAEVLAPPSNHGRRFN
ncbi:MAG: aminoglycoside phosphotransferase family protein [Gammaproteobacteria bacterium]